MDLDTILMIVSAVLAIAATIFGAKFDAVKKKFAQVKDLVKEGTDVVQVAVDAVADNNITPEEAEAIKKEAQEVIGAFKALIGKE
jgi:predicted metal-binding transcription factor (methanogenesis marker protein 9)